MASEYLKWKYRDIKPDKPIHYTRKEKVVNWFYYHKWHLVIGVVLFVCAVDILRSALGIGEIHPDYQIAYIGTYKLPDDTVSALEEALAALGEDANGDGKVLVQVNQYASTERSEASDSLTRELKEALEEDTNTPASNNNDTAGYAYAAEITMMADLEECDSYFFLLEEPDAFQRDYQVLRCLDGTLPGNGDRDYENCYVAWTECPVLGNLDLGTYTEEFLGRETSGDNQELLSGLYLARRGFWTEKISDNIDACDSLWDILTKGAMS